MTTYIMIGVISAAALGGLVFLFLFMALCFRTVVSTNDTDVVQRRRTTVPYGKGTPAGNTYYKWPSWVPFFGVMVNRMPITVFPISLRDYAAYDKGRVPFVIDIIGFFRVADPSTAAERLKDIDDLKMQLTGILQGAIRSILASSEIEEILEGRSKFGDMFTHAVDDQLKNWGVQTVKTIELMDIRDASDSKVIANIMMKKKSFIEMQSRTEVAANMQKAQIAEVEAEQAVGVRKQEALQAVNVRTATQQKETEVANQQAQQYVADQKAVTIQKIKEVDQINAVRTAEIEKAVQVVQAQQQKEVDVVKAEGQKQQTILIAEGNLEQRKREAEAIELKGKAEGSARYELEVAPVNAQIVLAAQIGENDGYQKYLVTVKGIEKEQAIGVAQAQALSKAEVKVIANTGDKVSNGLNSVMDLFSAAGGTAVGSALEALTQTPAGAAVVNKLTAKAPKLNGSTDAH
ncbi:MAG: SPFH domain-containing protein [Candidatus Bathyarchaeia archaeon]